MYKVYFVNYLKEGFRFRVENTKTGDFSSGCEYKVELNDLKFYLDDHDCEIVLKIIKDNELLHINAVDTHPEPVKFLPIRAGVDNVIMLWKLLE